VVLFLQLNISSPSNGKLAVQTFFDVPALPLYTILAALEWKEIDFFSLDIGKEPSSVLKNFPFHLISFKVIMVQVYYASEVERQALNDLLTVKDYVFVKEFAFDLSIVKVYVHNSVKYMIPQ